MSASCPVLRSPPPQLKRRFVSANVDHFERISNAGVVPKALQFEACNVFDLFGHTKKPVAASASRYRRRRGAPRGMTLNSSRRTFSFCEFYNTKNSEIPILYKFVSSRNLKEAHTHHTYSTQSVSSLEMTTRTCIACVLIHGKCINPFLLLKTRPYEAETQWTVSWDDRSEQAGVGVQQRIQDASNVYIKVFGAERWMASARNTRNFATGNGFVNEKEGDWDWGSERLPSPNHPLFHYSMHDTDSFPGNEMSPANYFFSSNYTDLLSIAWYGADGSAHNTFSPSSGSTNSEASEFKNAQWRLEGCRQVD